MRSATWPQMGWKRPFSRTESAMAKAKPEADQPCASVIGARNSPKDWRSPMASAAQLTAQRMRRPAATLADLSVMGGLARFGP